jgi:hypothetical protein
MTDPATDPDYLARNHPKLRFLHDYWLSKRRELGRLPGRADIDPVEVFELLPYIVLWDVIDGGKDLRIRLAGSHFEEAHERAMRGFRMSEWIRSRQDAAVWERLRTVIQGRQPDFRHTELPFLRRPYIVCDRVMLPLASDGVTVDVVLSAYIHRDAGSAPVLLASAVR